MKHITLFENFVDQVNEKETLIFDAIGTDLAKLGDKIDDLLNTTKDQNWIVALKGIQSAWKSLEDKISKADQKLGAITEGVVNENHFNDTLSKIKASVTYKGKGGEKVEVKEIEGKGMAGEPMTFAYVLVDGYLVSTQEKINTRYSKLNKILSPADFKELSDYLEEISDANSDSAISFAE